MNINSVSIIIKIICLEVNLLQIKSLKTSHDITQKKN